MSKVQFNLQPTLIGKRITLRPLHLEDQEELYLAASDPLIWEQHPDSSRHQCEVFNGRFFPDALASGGTLVAREDNAGEIIGCSRFYDWNAEKREVAIGYTFLIRKHWGGSTNGEMKDLTLSHAFRAAHTVWFHISSDNIRSIRAIERIGGVYSGRLRRESQGQDSFISLYAITDRMES